MLRMNRELTGRLKYKRYYEKGRSMICLINITMTIKVAEAAICKVEGKVEGLGC